MAGLSGEEWDARVARQEDEVAEAFVSLMLHIATPPKGGFVAYSGFVFRVEDVWVLVTAEHIFTGSDGQPGLLDLLKQHPNSILVLQPFTFGKDAGTQFVLDDDNWFSTSKLAEAWKDRVEAHIYDAMRSADLACIILSDYYVRHLKAVGVRAFAWDQVRLRDNDEALRDLTGQQVTTKLFGVPASCTELDLDNRTVSAHLLYLPVEPVGEDPPFTFWAPTWTDDLKTDIRGTSGGPIVLLGVETPIVMGVQIAQDRVDGKRRYKAVNGYFFFEFIASSVRERIAAIHDASEGNQHESESN